MTETTIDDIRQAAERIAPHVHRTPVLTSSALDEMAGARLFFKCENFQRTGSFKPRGATNAVFSLSDADAGRGVTTHSSGNFAAALALAARSRGVDAFVVMPRNAPAIKREAVAGYGAEIHLCEPTLEAREQGVEKLIAERGATFIHPYNDYRIIAGQGTAALELTEQVDYLDAVFCPVGGGGLCSGTAIAVKSLRPGAGVVGVEPELADDARRSMEAGEIIPSTYPDTIADGLRTSLGDLTFPLLARHVNEIRTVTEEQIVSAMRLAFERMKVVIEPSAAVGLAAALAAGEELTGLRVGIILSGGNLDLDRLPWQE